MQNDAMSLLQQFSQNSKLHKPEQSTVMPSPIGHSSPNLDRIMDQMAEQDFNEHMANEIVAKSTAKAAAFTIYKEMSKFQSELDDTHDVAVSLVQFGGSITVLVDKIGYSGYNLVVFYGTDTSGNKVELIQHINQLSFILVAYPKEAEVQKRQIGFVGN